MIYYLIEFAILHILFLSVYKLFLSRETQLRFLRAFLLGSTLLSLVIPLLEIPTIGEIPTISLEAVILSTPEISQVITPNSASLPTYLLLLIGVSGVFFLRLLLGLIRIGIWYKKSEHDTSFDFPIRKIEGAQNSFTFLKWIFIDPDHFENPDEIIKHEWGHVRRLHSLDILFLNLLTVPFWCVPSIWIMIHELKKIHEYEADQYAVNFSNQNSYIKTLVHSTLWAHGLNLASSFNDAPIVQRLNFIKKMKKKVSPWKVGSVMAIVLISGAMFACQDELDAEIQKILENSNQQIAVTDEIEEALKVAMVENPGKEFVVVDIALEHEESIRRLKQHDDSQIEAFFVQKWSGIALHETLEEGHAVEKMEESEVGRIVMIVAKDSEIYKRTLHLEQAKESHEVVAIAEKAPQFPGGMEKWHDYIDANLEYPEEAQKKGKEGNVFIQFIVEKDGSISSVSLAKGIDSSLDEAALRVVKASPKWIPAEQNDVSVRMKLVTPIKFRL